DAVDVRLGLRAGGRPAGDEPTTLGETFRRVVPRLRADVVDDDVDAPPVGELAHLAREVVLGVVDRVVGPALLGVRQLLVGARGRVDLRAGVVGNLDRCLAHSPGGTEDQDGFASLDV